MCAVCGKKQFSFLFSHHNNWEVAQCIHCGLVQVHPTPSEKEVAALYHEDMDHFAPYEDQISVHRAYFRQKVQQMKKQTTRRTADFSVLDIGCALGVLLEEVKRVGWRAIGIDISADAVRYCKKKKLRVLEGTMNSLAQVLGAGTFNVVTAFEIIEHERDPLGMMRRIYAVLKNGGVAVITTPNHDSIFRKLMGKWWFGYQHPEHVFFFDPASITFLLKKAGFSSVRVENDTPRPFPLSFAFTRAAHYLPFIGIPLRAVGNVLVTTRIKNPINPWSDMIVFAKK